MTATHIGVIAAAIGMILVALCCFMPVLVLVRDAIGWGHHVAEIATVGSSRVPAYPLTAWMSIKAVTRSAHQSSTYTPVLVGGR
jgi:hypothetical protein